MVDAYADRHIVVTGGTGALGKAVLESLLARGAWCHVPDTGSIDLIEGLPEHERLRYVPNVDVTNEIRVIAFYAGVPDLWASLHLVGGYCSGAIEETSLADFRTMFEMNVTTCFLCCREAIARMRANRAAAHLRSPGRIVNVAARPAIIPAGGMIAYSVAKSAVVGLTQSLAEETKADEILVNAVAPSIIDTPANRQAMPNADHMAWPSPPEIAEAILFYASPHNRITSGAVIPVYGRA
jgi:NAD(P)-dependent dehydrogenase (short-subunit alcohol dehydrogenase family)